MATYFQTTKTGVAIIKDEQLIGVLSHEEFDKIYSEAVAQSIKPAEIVETPEWDFEESTDEEIDFIIYHYGQAVGDICGNEVFCFETGTSKELKGSKSKRFQDARYFILKELDI